MAWIHESIKYKCQANDRLFVCIQSACWTFPFAFAKCSAFQSSLLALVMHMTSFLAAVRDQLNMFLMLPQMWSNVYYICTSISRDPTATAWRRKRRVQNKRKLYRERTTLKESSYDMLFQSI